MGYPSYVSYSISFQKIRSYVKDEMVLFGHYDTEQPL